MTPDWLSAGEALAALGGACLAALATALWLARGLVRSRKRWLALERRLDDLSIRLRMLESRAAASAAPPPPQAPRRAADRPPSRTLRVEPSAQPAMRKPTLIAVPSLETTGSDVAAHEASAELGRRYAAIWAMADSGETAGSIARTTGQPIGQVELILGLRRPPAAQARGEAVEHA